MNNQGGKGLYVHVPFCVKKCPYCDFYSIGFQEDLASRYASSLERNIRALKPMTFDTVFFGGGTPVLLWEEISRLLPIVPVSKDAEITIEANPGFIHPNSLTTLRGAGVNRISLGVQSLQDRELQILGRLHSAQDAIKAVHSVQDAGFSNISVDLMLGVSGQTKESLKNTIQRLGEISVTHVSAYLLKIEQGTEYGRNPPDLPSEEVVTGLYLTAVEELEKLGFIQYEISNFSKKGYQCRHNLKYWQCEEYLGIGPGAHSYLDGKRFEVSRDLVKFLSDDVQETLINQESPGDFTERAMLGLRLCEGISVVELRDYLGGDKALQNRLKRIPKHYYSINDDTLSITKDGFLLSNQLIGILLF